VSATATSAPALAACEGVSVVHGHGDARVTALDAVHIEAAAGERLALWGRSGSGKTTVLHALGGLVRPTSGEVHWRGSERPGAIGYVFQGANLLPHFTAFENVAFAAQVAGAESDPEELLGLVGLAAKLDSLPAELSGGEAQRVAIARALAQRPELLLCDEPTGHLDSDTGRRVLDLIDALQAELGFALIIATHDADVAARADRIVVLVDGRVVDEDEL
jgi:putative ABC transport system ATP-binding protein